MILFYTNKNKFKTRSYSIFSKSQAPRNKTEHVIFSFSRHELTDFEKSLLVKGLNYVIPPNVLNYADYLANYELLYRDIKGLGILSNEDLNFTKTKIKEAALTSFRSYNSNGFPRNLSDEEFDALQNLSKNTNLVVQKSDKGNSVVLVDKEIYVKRMENILSDNNKFRKDNIAPGKLLNLFN